MTCVNIRVFISGVDRTALCPLHSPGAANGTIVTKDIDGRLVWMGSSSSSNDEKVGMTFTPEAGVSEPFYEIQITGATCPLATGGTNLKLSGNIIATNDSPTTVDAVVQKLEFPATADLKYFTYQTPTRTEDTDTGLTLGGTAATIAGTFAFDLAGGPAWGIEPG